MATKKQLSFKELLEMKCACDEAREFVGNKSLERAWKTCKRGDWMVWILCRMAGTRGWPTRRKLLAQAFLAAKELADTTDEKTKPHLAVIAAKLKALSTAPLSERRRKVGLLKRQLFVYSQIARKRSNAARYLAADRYYEISRCLYDENERHGLQPERLSCALNAFACNDPKAPAKLRAAFDISKATW